MWKGGFVSEQLIKCLVKDQLIKSALGPAPFPASPAFTRPVRSPGSQIEPDGRKSNRFYTVCKMADGSRWLANLVQQKEPHELTIEPHRATYNNIILPVFLATFPPHSRPRRPPSPSAAGLQPRPFMVPRVFGTAVPVVEPARRWRCCISWLVVAWR
ncbi:hypothetical protein DFH09DRAFT_1112093 [Mycena vulgaris]|nr:hypothetical protein DFH09DRAFT_1112093 [Mycena vulgaris]